VRVPLNPSRPTRRRPVQPCSVSVACVHHSRTAQSMLSGSCTPFPITTCWITYWHGVDTALDYFPNRSTNTAAQRPVRGTRRARRLAGTSKTAARCTRRRARLLSYQGWAWSRGVPSCLRRVRPRLNGLYPRLHRQQHLRWPQRRPGPSAGPLWTFCSSFCLLSFPRPWRCQACVFSALRPHRLLPLREHRSRHEVCQVAKGEGEEARRAEGPLQAAPGSPAARQPGSPATHAPHGWVPQRRKRGGPRWPEHRVAARKRTERAPRTLGRRRIRLCLALPRLFAPLRVDLCHKRCHLPIAARAQSARRRRRAGWWGEEGERGTAAGKRRQGLRGWLREQGH